MYFLAVIEVHQNVFGLSLSDDFACYFTFCIQGHNEWITEVNFLGVVKHPNLVKLVGYCAEDDERGMQRLLVYELMRNKSLADIGMNSCSEMFSISKKKNEDAVEIFLLVVPLFCPFYLHLSYVFPLLNINVEHLC